MRIAHEQVNADLVDMELIELKFLFDRGMTLYRKRSAMADLKWRCQAHYDNRDMKILLNYQPRIQGSFDEQTTLFGQHPGVSG